MLSRTIRMPFCRISTIATHIIELSLSNDLEKIKTAEFLFPLEQSAHYHHKHSRFAVLFSFSYSSHLLRVPLDFAGLSACRQRKKKLNNSDVNVCVLHKSWEFDTFTT